VDQIAGGTVEKKTSVEVELSPLSQKVQLNPLVWFYYGQSGLRLSMVHIMPRPAEERVLNEEKPKPTPDKIWLPLGGDSRLLVLGR
jgi:hypothetical protein